MEMLSNVNNMVNLKLTRQEVQELRLAMIYHREKQEEVGLKWEKDQQRIVEKLNYAVLLDKESNPLKSVCKKCGKEIEALNYEWYHILPDGSRVRLLKGNECINAWD